MTRPFALRAAIFLLTAQAGAAAAARNDSPREFLGQAAFGLQQVDVTLAALAAVIVLFVVSTVSRRYWIVEIAFLLLVAAGLVSNAFGMIALTMSSLFSVLALGWILDKLGFSAQLTPQDTRRIEGQVDTTLREDLHVDPQQVRNVQAPAAAPKSPE